MKAVPVFSVIIPTCNRAELLRRALESVAVQSCRDFEVIVCDDGSTDHTCDVVSAFAGRMNVSYFREEKWGGPARPRNRGIEAASGEWVCFLDSDDWWYPEKLAAIRRRVADADVIFHDCTVHSRQGRRLFKMTGRHLVRPVFVDLLTGWNPLITSSVAVRARLVTECGCFSEDRRFIAVEDFDLWLRISRRTDRFVYLAKPLGAYWEDGGNISRYSGETLVRERAIYETHVPLLSPGERRYAERMINYRAGLVYWHMGRYRESRAMFLRSLGAKRLRHRMLAYAWIARTLCADALPR